MWGFWALAFRGLRVWGFGVEGLGFKIQVWAGLGCRGDKGLELRECSSLGSRTVGRTFVGASKLPSRALNPRALCTLYGPCL